MPLTFSPLSQHNREIYYLHHARWSLEQDHWALSFLRSSRFRMLTFLTSQYSRRSTLGFNTPSSVQSSFSFNLCLENWLSLSPNTFLSWHHYLGIQKILALLVQLFCGFGVYTLLRKSGRFHHAESSSTGTERCLYLCCFCWKLFLLFRIFLWFHMTFKIIFYLCEECHWYFGEDCATAKVFYFYFVFLAVLGTEPMAWGRLGQLSTNELHPQPLMRIAANL